MSWIDRVQNNLVITTGDGKQYNPNWIVATKAKEYNIAEFNFPEISGTLVKRGTPKGKRYPLEFYFQGEDHIEIANAFEISADDKRPWTISHPYYDRIVCHPISLTFDNNRYNVSKIVCEVLETIDDKNPKTTVDPQEDALIKKANLDETIAATFEADVIPDTDDINQMIDVNEEVYGEGKKFVLNDLDFQNYFNAFNEANSAILNGTDDAFQAMNKLQAVINAPFQFVDTVKNRIAILKSQFNKLKNSIVNLLTKPSKKIYEATNASLVSSLALSSMVNIDYDNAGDVLDVIDDILDNYNDYISRIDSLQSINNGNEDSYLPDFNVQVQLNDLIVFVVNNLLDVALNSRQERRIFIEDDTNAIILAHRFIGLDINDDNLNKFINDNQIGLNELLQIKKGREIVYYV